MTNEQKYKTPEERVKAFGKFCNGQGCTNCILKDRPVGNASCAFYWLALEAEEEENPEPCPFCGEQMTFTEYGIACRCGYSKVGASREASIAAHNRLVRAVKAANENKGERGE